MVVHEVPLRLCCSFPRTLSSSERGAWDDVPDATKWVDELRGGDEEPPNSTTDVVETEKPCGWVNENGIFAKQLPDDLVYSWKPVYIAPPEARQDKA